MLKDNLTHLGNEIKIKYHLSLNPNNILEFWLHKKSRVLEAMQWKY